MEIISEDLGEQIISQLRELIFLLETKFGKQKEKISGLDLENGSK